MVLLVVDTQKALVNDQLYLYEKYVDNIKRLISKARERGIEVIYVIHDDGPGSELTQGQPGFEVDEEFKPLSSEEVFIKNVDSAFKNTGLREYLVKKNQQEVIGVGLQTDKWINATVISGFEHGFHMIIPAYANSTVDNDYMDSEKSYMYFNDFMWNGRYGECVSVEEMIHTMDS